MAFSLRIGCLGNNHSFTDFSINNNRCIPSGGATRPVPVMFVGDQSRSRGQNRRIMVAAALTTAPVTATTGLKMNLLSLDMEQRGTGDRAEGKDDVDASDRMDRWMWDSVEEIVMNLKEAPLLVHVFTKGNIDGDDVNGRHMMTMTTTLMTEKRAIKENWLAAKEKWIQGRTPLPEGLILVEELAGDVTEKTTKVWGIVVQGRGAGCGAVCYLLKTTRVGATPMGPWCTHFCLTRVKNLMETVESQFSNFWRDD